VPKQPFGEWIDERVVEYPWILEQLSSLRGGRLLDAGAGLNVVEPLRVLHAQRWSVSSITLQREAFADPQVQYQEGDLRKLPFADGAFDAVCCVSTLEHVGMDNARYAQGCCAVRSDPGDWQVALAEMWRVTAAGGSLFVTVPCGRAADHGWFQVFSPDLAEQVQLLLRGAQVESHYFMHRADGWLAVPPSQLATCECWDPNGAPRTSKPRAAFSEGVLCLVARRQSLGLTE